MKVRHLASLFLLLLALAGPSAHAVPVDWTLSPVTLNGGSTVSGTFTFDADTNTLSNVNVVSTGTRTGTFSYSGVVASGSAFTLQQTAAANSGDLALHFLGHFLTNAGGSATMTITLVRCGITGAALCDGGLQYEQSVQTLSGVAPPAGPSKTAAVPTLGEYGLMVVALMTAWLGMRHLRRRRSF